MAEQLQPDLTVKTIADFLQTVINYYAGFNFIQKVFHYTDDDCNIMIRIQLAEPIPENMSKKLNTLSKAIAIWLARAHDPTYMNDLKIQNIANLGRHGKI